MAIELEGRSRSIGVSEGPAKSNRNKVDTSCAGSESLRSSTAKSVIGSRSPPPHNVKCSMYLYLSLCVYPGHAQRICSPHQWLPQSF